MFKKTILASAVALALMASNAYSADLLFVNPEPARVEAVSDSWDGFYVGINGIVNPNGDAPANYGVGLSGGYDTQIGVFIVGGEVQLQGFDEFDTTYGAVLGKAGVAVTDEAAVFALGGFGTDLGAADTTHGLVGVGGEYRLTSNVSLKADYLHGFVIDETGPELDRLSAGVSFKF